MKVLSSRQHGVFDYLLGVVLITAPWVLGFVDVSVNATYTVVSIGIVTIALSLLTRYPLGLFKLIPFPIHGVGESVAALALIASPWLFNFADVTMATNLTLIAGLAWLLLVALTNYQDVAATTSAHTTHRPGGRRMAHH